MQDWRSWLKKPAVIGAMVAVVVVIALAVIVTVAFDRKLERSAEIEPEAVPVVSPSEELKKVSAPLQEVGSTSLRVLEPDSGAMLVSETASPGSALRLSRRSYPFPDGTCVSMLRAEGEKSPALLYQTSVPEKSGTVRTFDEASGKWSSAPLSALRCNPDLAVIEFESGKTVFVYMPKTYRVLENDVLEHIPEQDGLLRTVKTKSGWQLQVYGNVLSETVCDTLIMEADHALFDWSGSSNSATVWASHTRNGVSKWCYSGYYRTTPYNYIPTGENCYYRCAASYLPRLITEQLDLCKAAAPLAIAMLDTVALQQNQYGFWPTVPESEWLSSDYNISGSFYDTRFNTDLIEIYINCNRKLGSKLFLSTIRRYCDYYTAFAAQSHTETASGGWLVHDYWQPDAHYPTHTSLNHQLAECLTLYHLADLLKDESIRALGDRLLLAVQDTGTGWIRSDCDLHYCIFADGTYGKEDYPYLTYNDLFALQEYLVSAKGSRDETLDTLMSSKLIWMINHGITGYSR